MDFLFWKKPQPQYLERAPKKEVLPEKFNWQKLEEQKNLESRIGAMSSAVFFPNGKLLASVEKKSRDGQVPAIRLLAIDGQREIGRFQAKSNVLSLAATADGQIIYGGDDKYARILNPQTEEVREIQTLTKDVTALATMKDGNILYGGADGLVGILHAKSGQELRHFFALEGSGGITSLAELADGKIAAGCNDGSIRILDPKTGAELKKINNIENGAVTALMANPDGSSVAGTENGSVVVLDDLRYPVEVLARHEEPVTALGYDAWKKQLYSTSQDGISRVWNTKEETAPAANFKL
ncbi:MAG: hypothetical protein Q8P76_02855 [bacterium]|nr:hypothetical protein [bacterium]